MYLAIIILGHQSANCFEATHVIQVSVLYATVQVRNFLKYILTYLYCLKNDLIIKAPITLIFNAIVKFETTSLTA